MFHTAFPFTKELLHSRESGSQMKHSSIGHKYLKKILDGEILSLGDLTFHIK